MTLISQYHSKKKKDNKSPNRVKILYVVASVKKKLAVVRWAGRGAQNRRKPSKTLPTSSYAPVSACRPPSRAIPDFPPYLIGHNRDRTPTPPRHPSFYFATNRRDKSHNTDWAALFGRSTWAAAAADVVVASTVRSSSWAVPEAASSVFRSLFPVSK